MATLKELMAAKKAQIAEQSGRRVNTVKPKQGSTRFRILPSWRGVDEDQFYHDFGQHFIKDEKGQIKAVYVCVEKTYSKPCVICDMIREGIHESKDDDQKALLKQAFASGRVLVNALQVETDRTTPVILELSPTTFDKIIDIYQQNVDDDDESFNIITNINDGVDIIITRAGTGLTTEYSVQPALKGSKPVGKEVLAKMANLDEFVAQEQELALLKATSAAREVISGTKALPKPKPTDAEFDDDVPAFDDEDEDDSPLPESTPKPAAKPAAKSAAKAAVKDDDVLEGEYVKGDTGVYSDDELNSLLDELDD